VVRNFLGRLELLQKTLLCSSQIAFVAKQFPDIPKSSSHTRTIANFVQHLSGFLKSQFRLGEPALILQVNCKIPKDICGAAFIVLFDAYFKSRFIHFLSAEKITLLPSH